LRSTTTLKLISFAPIEISSMGISASASKTRVQTPRVRFRRSPTTATIARSSATETSANAAISSASERTGASCSTVSETLSSAVATRSTETRRRAKTSKRRARKPACWSIRGELAVITWIGPRLAIATTSRPDEPFFVIVVKRPLGRRVCRTVTGIPASTAGWIVAGWSTFAPNAASSPASAAESCAMGRARSTRRGSAVSTPSTSVQIWISEAPSAAPKIAAL
jgi:hypothetical protein